MMACTIAANLWEDHPEWVIASLSPRRYDVQPSNPDGANIKIAETPFHAEPLTP
jgi:hypothetical protein